MLRIGLTGGIGSGKSSVCETFRQLGVAVVDTDQIARQVVVPGSEGLQQLIHHFGREILDQSGALDRAKMRQLVFTHKHQRQWLESTLHPLIRAELQRQLERLREPYVIIAIPLLVERQWQQQVDRVLLIDCSETVQRERASQRDGCNDEEIAQIMATQASREQRRAIADDIIHNDTTLDDLEAQVATLHQHYLRLAAAEEC